MTQNESYLAQYKAQRTSALARIVDICSRVGKAIDNDREGSLFVKLDLLKIESRLEEDRAYYDEHKALHYIVVEGGSVWTAKGLNDRHNASLLDEEVLFAIVDFLNSKIDA
jgi:hypothetical protein